ncbi:MAG: fimbrillin family protein [Rikenellaceae bacterium]
MKRLLLSVAVLAAFASCSKNEVNEMPQSNQIGFSSLNDRVTSKAANDLTGVDAVAFKVFAANGAGATAWYINDYVTGGATDATAPANGPHYWPTDKSAMAFYAYAPYFSDATNNVTEGTGMDATTLSYVVPADAQEDFTVATPVTCAGGEEAYPESVDFTFKHMLAKVTVQVKLDVDYGKNNYISTSFTDAADAPFTATFTALKNALSVDAQDAVAALPAETTTNASTALAYADKQMYYIAPQAFKDCKLQINGITIRNSNTHKQMFTGDLDVITLTGTELQSTGETFVAGNHYILTVTVSADATDLIEIKCTADNGEWADSTDVPVTQTVVD